MLIQSFRDFEYGTRTAQSSKSKYFHFNAKICRECNSSKTQAPDKEFEKFHLAVDQLFEKPTNPSDLFQSGEYKKGEENYLNIFRYFSKLMCCHLAEAEYPVPTTMSKFSIGRSKFNRIWLSIDKDWSYSKYEEAVGPIQYAAHGGLVVFGDHKRRGPTGFHSTLTIGKVRYKFFFNLAWIERLELRLFYPSVWRRCNDIIEYSINNPMTDEERKSLGLN